MNSPKLTLEIKIALFNACHKIIDDKINSELEAMESAQAAANLETKSSAGDKYETGRAMMHLEKEKLSFQLAASKKMKQVLDNLIFQDPLDVIKPGAAFITDQGNFFICAGLGEVTVEELTFQTISLGSPLGKEFLNKKVGDSINFKANTFNIQEVI